MSEQPPASPPPPPPGFPPPPGPPPSGPPSFGPPSFGPPSFGPPPAAKPKRARVVLAVVAAVVVLAAAVVVPLVVLGDDDEPDRAGESGAAATEDSQEAAGDDLADVVTYDDLPTTHVDDPVDYDQVPPVGGAHFDQWLDCGVYDAPVPDENAVHDLEHGAVWITYDPDLGADDVATLTDALPQNGIMSPYDGLPAPVVVTVWGTQLELTGADDPRLPLFVREYSGGVTAPEPMASCAGGTADPGGGAVGA